MKNLRFIFNALLIIFYSSNIFSQECNPNCNFGPSINISTGIDPTSGSTLSTGTTDPEWELVNIPLLEGGVTPPAAVSIPNAYVINNYVSSWNNIPGSRALSANNSANFNINNLNLSQPWKFRRYFCICQDVEVNISGVFRADDQGRLSLYNVNSNAVIFSQGQPNAPNTNNFYTDTPFSQSVVLPAGNYYLEFEMRNTSSTAMGFAINGSISSINGSSSISNGSESCCSNYFISGRKIIDNNCNGELDTSDIGGAGWSFNLIDNATNTIMATAISDAYGDFIFNDVPLGNYEVKEVPQSGWVVSNPSSGSYNINVTSNSVNYLSFFNCADPYTPVYCCGGETVLNNGNIESGNVGFTSNYSHQASISTNSVRPGQYTVSDMTGAASISSNWLVDDHSICNGGSGNQFILVNGKTTQTSGTNSAIYEQTITGLDTDSTYKFCGFFKNLPQCTFDILPEIKLEATNISYASSSNWTTISQNASDPCAWQEEGIKFRPLSSTISIKILLKEDGLGDGNDLGIDDLAVQMLPAPELEITVENQSINATNTQITASINNLTNSDDILPDTGCEHLWIIAEASSINGPYSNLGWGNATTGWGLTTTFPGYNGGVTNGTFQTGKLYLIALLVQNCECVADGYTLQYTYDMRLNQNGKLEKVNMTKEEEDRIKNQLLEFVKNNDHNQIKTGGSNIQKPSRDISNIKIHPNPSKGKFNIIFKNPNAQTEIIVTDSKGTEIMSSFSKEEIFELNLDNYPSGIYFLQIRQGGEVFTERLVKVH